METSAEPLSVSTAPGSGTDPNRWKAFAIQSLEPQRLQVVLRL